MHSSLMSHGMDKLSTDSGIPDRHKRIKDLMTALDKKYRANSTTFYGKDLLKEVLPLARTIGNEAAAAGASRGEVICREEFFQILLAASDLGIRDLVEHMCCRLARTINGCETATEVQELFGIRNDLIGQSILIAETKYYCRRNYFMYQDALGSFTLTDEFKSHSRRNTVRNICDDSADIKSRRCAWRRADINIEGSASNYRGHTAVSISNKAGEQRVVWKSKLDYASQRIAADMVNGRSRTGPVAGLPMEVLLLMLSMVRSSKYPMLQGSCPLFHSLIPDTVLQTLSCTPFDLSDPSFQSTEQASDYVGVPSGQLSFSSVAKILEDPKRSQFVRKLVLIGNSMAIDDIPPQCLTAALPNASNLQCLIIKWFDTGSIFLKLPRLQRLLSLTVPSLRGLGSGSGLPSLRFLIITSHASGDPAVSHFDNVISLHMTLYKWAVFPGTHTTAIDGHSMKSLQHLSLDGSADGLQDTFFNVIPDSFRSLDIDGFRIRHENVDAFIGKIAPRLEYLRMRSFMWPVSAPFGRLEVLEIYCCETKILSHSSFPLLTHLRVTDIHDLNPLVELRRSIHDTVEILLIEQLNQLYRGILPYIKTDNLLGALKLRRLGFTGFCNDRSLNVFRGSHLEVFQSDKEVSTLHKIDRDRRFARRARGCVHGYAPPKFDDADAEPGSECGFGSNQKTFRCQYDIQEKLGKGGFGTVHLCVEKGTGHKYAVKKFEKCVSGPGRPKIEGIQQEIAILTSVSHENIINLKETFEESDGIYLVLELAPKGDLCSWVQKKTHLTEDEARVISVQLFRGVRYLHERNIVHRDIKLENILIMDDKCFVKLTDFGLAKVVDADSVSMTTFGTPAYVAPEVIQNPPPFHYTKAVDIWSLGVVLYACLGGFMPFSQKHYKIKVGNKTNELITRGEFYYFTPFWDSVSDLARELINKMLTVDVGKRITIDACLQDSWAVIPLESVG